MLPDTQSMLERIRVVFLLTQFTATGNANRESLTEWPEFSGAGRLLILSHRTEHDTDLYTTGWSLYANYQKPRP